MGADLWSLTEDTHELAFGCSWGPSPSHSPAEETDVSLCVGSCQKRRAGSVVCSAKAALPTSAADVMCAAVCLWHVMVHIGTNRLYCPSKGLGAMAHPALNVVQVVVKHRSLFLWLPYAGVVC